MTRPVPDMPYGSIDVLTLDAAHAPVAAAIHAAAFAGGDDPWDASAIATLSAMPGVFGFLARRPAFSMPSGFILARIATGEAEILTLAVVPEQRRRGIARRLVCEAIGHARERGAQTIYLEVAEDNPAARALYQREGFLETGRRVGYYRRSTGERVDALLLCYRVVAE